MPDMSMPKPTLSRADELNSVGAQLFGRGQVEPARLHFLAALSLDPNHALALQNLGAALRQLGHYAASEVVAKRSVVASNGNPYCKSNLGVALFGLRKFDEALRILREATVEMPEAAGSWHNYGLVLYMMGRYEAALVAFDKGLALGQDNAHMQSDRALTLLSLGRIQEGLEAYEVRWDILAKSTVWDLAVPEWKGEDLTGRHLLVHHEQGFGDSVMLARFISALHERGAIITLAMPGELMSLMQENFPYVKVVDLKDEAFYSTMVFDYHTPLLSAMRWLGIARPKEINAAPYIKAEPFSALNLPPGFKVGLCWASGDHGPALMDRRRLVPVVDFLPLLEKPGISLISLQKGKEAGDLVKNGLEGLIFDVSSRLDSFHDTARVIAALDLVISVDSAVVHLAAAMGKPTIMLSPYTRCWRWWGLCSGKPWYNDMTVASQSKDGSWKYATNLAVLEANAAFAGHQTKLRSKTNGTD